MGGPNRPAHPYDRPVPTRSSIGTVRSVRWRVRDGERPNPSLSASSFRCFSSVFRTRSTRLRFSQPLFPCDALPFTDSFSAPMHTSPCWHGQRCPAQCARAERISDRTRPVESADRLSTVCDPAHAVLSECGYCTWTLEAAHIDPYCNSYSDSPGNGLLLRRDLHALFDSGYLAIDPASRKAYLGSEAREWPRYARLHRTAMPSSPQPGFDNDTPNPRLFANGGLASLRVTLIASDEQRHGSSPLGPRPRAPSARR